MAYIERETYSKALKGLISDSDGGTNYEKGYIRGLATANGILLDENQTPTADVVEVRHSYWQCSNVRMSSRDITCRYCHRTETISNGNEDFEYCPHCGAKMDGKDEE